MENRNKIIELLSDLAWETENTACRNCTKCGCENCEVEIILNKVKNFLGWK